MSSFIKKNMIPIFLPVTMTFYDVTKWRHRPSLAEILISPNHVTLYIIWKLISYWFFFNKEVGVKSQQERRYKPKTSLMTSQFSTWVRFSKLSVCSSFLAKLIKQITSCFCEIKCLSYYDIVTSSMRFSAYIFFPVDFWPLLLY